MRQFLVAGLLCLPCLALVAGCGGDDKPHKPHAAIYEVGYEEVDKETDKPVAKEETFDLRKPEKKERLLELLDKGEVEELKLAREPDIFDLRWDLGVWTLVVFVLLLLILNKVAWKPMLEGLKRREESIHSDLAEARSAREEGERLRQQFQVQLDKAQEQVRDVLDAARKDAQRNTDEMIARTRSEIQAERDRLRREIDTARDQALQELWQQSAQLATLISAKAIRRELTAEDHRRLVDDALAELRQAGKDGHQGGGGLRL